MGLKRNEDFGFNDEYVSTEIDNPASITNGTSNGTTAEYYKLPGDAKEIQDLISFKDMNSQMGEIGRTWYRYGECSHSDKMREINKIIFYAQAEKDRLIKYCGFNED